MSISSSELLFETVLTVEVIDESWDSLKITTVLRKKTGELSVMDIQKYV